MEEKTREAIQAKVIVALDKAYLKKEDVENAIDDYLLREELDTWIKAYWEESYPSEKFGQTTYDLIFEKNQDVKKIEEKIKNEEGEEITKETEIKVVKKSLVGSQIIFRMLYKTMVAEAREPQNEKKVEEKKEPTTTEASKDHQ